MTLTKAIEAAREALADAINMADGEGNPVEELMYSEALATLPDQPMTEDEIAEIIANTILLVREDNSRTMAQAIIDQLKAANVLYVEEK